MGRVKSWKYDDKEFKYAIKDLDKSSFKRGSHIPIKVRKVFECENVQYGHKKDIILIYDGKIFNADIEKEASGGIRMNWNKLIPTMKNVFKNEINDFEDSEELKLRVPKLKFIKQTPLRYDVEMSTEYSIDFVEEMDKLGLDISHKDIENSKDFGEVVERVIKARKNQNKFRQALLKREDKCKICGLACKELLVASHIKAWSKSSKEEKLDPNNGFLLCSKHDSLFDKHLITFSHDGKIIISKRLSESDKNILGLNDNIIIEISDENKYYLKAHRKVFYENENKSMEENKVLIKAKEIDTFKVEIEK